MEQLPPRAQSQPASEQETPASSKQHQPGQGAQKAFISLRQRNFRLFWFGQMISLIGSFMQIVGQSWLVLELTHSAWQLSLVGALQALPILCFSLFAGVFADHWPRRRVLLVVQALAMIQAFLFWLLIATNTIQLWHIYVLVLLLGITNSLGRPTFRAFITELVEREALPNAVALYSSLMSLTRIVGPGLGGLIIAVNGVNMLFLLNALSFLPIIASLLLINTHKAPIAAFSYSNAYQPQNPWQSLREGISYVWKTPVVLLIIMVVGLLLLFGSNFNVLLPLFATDVLYVGATGFGFLSAANGIGALLAGLWLAWNNRQSTIRRMLVIMLIFALLEAAFAVSRLYLLSLVLIASVGFAEEAVITQSMTKLHIMTPNHLRGRVMSVQSFFFDGSLPLGFLLMGWLASLCGASAALLIGAALSLLVAAIGWMWGQSVEARNV